MEIHIAASHWRAEAAFWEGQGRQGMHLSPNSHGTRSASFKMSQRDRAQREGGMLTCSKARCGDSPQDQAGAGSPAGLCGLSAAGLWLRGPAGSCRELQGVQGPGRAGWGSQCPRTARIPAGAAQAEPAAPSRGTQPAAAGRVSSTGRNLSSKAFFISSGVFNPSQCSRAIPGPSSADPEQHQDSRWLSLELEGMGVSSAAGQGEVDQRLPSSLGSSTVGKCSRVPPCRAPGVSPAAISIVSVAGLTQTGGAGEKMNVSLTTCGPCKMQLNLAQEL